MYWVDGQEASTFTYIYKSMFGEKDKGIFIIVGILASFLIVFIIILMANASPSRSFKNRVNQSKENK